MGDQMVTRSMMSRDPERSNTLKTQYRKNSWRCYFSSNRITR